MSKGRRVQPYLYGDNLVAGENSDDAFTHTGLASDAGVREAREVASPSLVAKRDEIVELLDAKSRSRNRSKIHAPFRSRFQRHLDYRKPTERHARDVEIEKRIGHPTFGLLRDAFGALHTEVLTGDMAKPGAVKRVRKELAHVLAMAKRLDSALASSLTKPVKAQLRL